MAESSEKSENEGRVSESLDCQVKRLVFYHGRNRNNGSLEGRMVFYKYIKAAVGRMYCKEIYTFLPDFRNCLKSLLRIGKTHKPSRIKN